MATGQNDDGLKVGIEPQDERDARYAAVLEAHTNRLLAQVREHHREGKHEAEPSGVCTLCLGLDV